MSISKAIHHQVDKIIISGVTQISNVIFMKNPMHRFSFIVLALLILTGCSREFVEGVYGVDYEPTNRFARNLAPYQVNLPKIPLPLIA